MPFPIIDSPEPIELVRLPWTEQLPVRDVNYGAVVPSGIMSLAELRVSQLARDDYLREAALEVADQALPNGLEQDLLLTDVRSGLYDPTNPDGWEFGFHFDVDWLGGTAVGSFILVTGEGLRIARGKASLTEEAWQEGHAENLPFYMLQAKMAARGISVFDLSQAKIQTLETGVLYYMPPYCLHASSTKSGPYPKHLFRYKNIPRLALK